MYRRLVNLIGKRNREFIILFYAVLFIRFFWSCIREDVGGCLVFDKFCFWTNGILAFLILLGSAYLLLIDHIRLDRLLSGGRLANILYIIAGILSVPFTLNFLIFLFYPDPAQFAREIFGESDPKSETSLLWAIFYHFMDPGNQQMAITHRAKMWTLLISMSGAVLMGGVLISSITNLLDRRGSNFMEGLCRYPYNFISRPSFGKFVIIIGGHEMVTGLCKDILEKNRNLDNIFILTSSDIAALRSNLRSRLRADEERIVVYSGYRGNEEELDALHPQYAEDIYIIGEGGEEPLHDQLNMKCVNYLSSVMPLTDKPVKCHVLFEYQTTFAAFQSSSIRSILDGRIEFLPFNYYETWAQKVTSDYLPIEGPSQEYESRQRVHIFIVGMSRMGVALGLEYAHMAHFPNFIRDKETRTRISFIDMDAGTESGYLMGRYKNLFGLSRWRYCSGDCEGIPWNLPERDFLDIEWEFLDGGVQTPYISDYIERQAQSNDASVTIAVCLPDSSQSLASALYLPDIVYVSENVRQILVYQDMESSIIDGINDKDMRYSKLKSFGTAHETYDEGFIGNDLKAMLVGGVYAAAYDMIASSASDENLYETLKDRFEEKGLREWKNSKIWAKWSNIYNSGTLKVKMRSCGMNVKDFDILRKNISLRNGKVVFNEEEIGRELMDRFRQLAEVEHNRWNIEKLLMGYRALTEKEMELFDGNLSKEEFAGLKGELKDKASRAHLDILPFSELIVKDSGAEDYDYLLSLMLPDIQEKSVSAKTC